MSDLLHRFETGATGVENYSKFDTFHLRLVVIILEAPRWQFLCLGLKLAPVLPGDNKRQ